MATRALVIACGNPLRGDDGVAARTLRLLGDVAGVERREVQQLLPELASEVAGLSFVVFVDADTRATAVCISELSGTAAVAVASPFSHAPDAAAIIALARGLFGWRGAAFTCGLPAEDFSFGTEPTARAARSARAGARALRRFLRERA